MRDVTDDCSPAFIDSDVFHPNGLLTGASVSLERLYLCRVGPRELVVGPFCTVLLRQIVHMG
jgi:hypothetical protein